MTEALLGLGGNVGEVRATLDEAIRRFADGTQVTLLKRSSDYSTPPWGDTDQPPFINCAISVETTLTPGALLARALEVERTLGRDRTKERHWGPRTIDIDLLAYGEISLDEPGLILPHPRLFERAFVLVPLAEIAPDRIVAGRRIGDAADQIDRTGVERLSPRD
jgi:2-amino-4-hydroxy-6-hydroxymethyldihydropteridine diphosphokinase